MAQIFNTKIAKILVPVAVVLLVAAAAVLFFTHSEFGSDKYYSVELDNGEIWYGKILASTPEFISLTEVYHFHGDNYTQLISHDPKLRSPKQINRERVISIEALKEGNPVLDAIEKYRQ